MSRRKNQTRRSIRRKQAGVQQFRSVQTRTEPPLTPGLFVTEPHSGPAGFIARARKSSILLVRLDHAREILTLPECPDWCKGRSFVLFAHDVVNAISGHNVAAPTATWTQAPTSRCSRSEINLLNFGIVSTMPRDLPGMYWDEEKQRYFPLSSRPAGGGGSAHARPTPPPVDSESLSQPKRRRKRKPVDRDPESPSRGHGRSLHTADSERASLWRVSTVLAGAPSFTTRRRCTHQTQKSYLSTRSIESDLSEHGARQPLDLGETVTALCARGDGSGEGNLWIGDGSGWLYTMNTKDHINRWREFYLGTQITSITRSGVTTLVTSLGSPARALVTRDQTLGLWLLREFPRNVCDDVWCGHVYGRTVVAGEYPVIASVHVFHVLEGGRRGAICFRDADQDHYVRLRCESDVFSVRFQSQDLMYIGMRNGNIERWDLRQPNNPPDSIVNMSQKHGGTPGAPIQHLRLIHQYGLLIETMRGDLEVHDLRYLRDATPLLQLQGHVSSYEHKLGLAIDPSEDFVFVGGGDNRLRAWSLRTGQPLHTETASLQSSPGRNPLHATFALPIRAIEVVTEDEKTSLWLGSNTFLHRVDLGPNGILR
ncbi:hypothetical protein OH77DRAFT_106624 [Trametes cingulata]|nr:hypothetical protein OH77DRAFT_106624 [Trametes cingulata]